MAHLDRAATRELDKAEIDPKLRELIRIRASQLNAPTSRRVPVKLTGDGAWVRYR